MRSGRRGEMDDFPAIAVPSSNSPKVEVAQFLLELHGPPNVGVPAGADIAAIAPLLLALDVRSPAEYAKGHIPGAVNLPLFGNEERAVVGTTYKQEGRYAAIREGLGYVGPKVRACASGLVLDFVLRVNSQWGEWMEGPRTVQPCARGFLLLCVLIPFASGCVSFPRSLPRWRSTAYRPAHECCSTAGGESCV
eukprot:SAG11_NODE_4381_length_1923_cov_1.936404_2_plen_193_part_00